MGVYFLQQKFETLLERLQRAESAEQERHDRCKVMEAEIQRAEAAAKSDRLEQEASQDFFSGEEQKLRWSISEAQREESCEEQALRQAHKAHEALVQRRNVLEEQCAGE